MNDIFKKIKEQITAREVAEGYGLKVNRNGMACCPFHDDHHPSMKIDKNYYCFGCGAKGDAVGYVAQMYGLTQYDAAKKIIQDYRLPIECGKALDSRQLAEIRKREEERRRTIDVKTRFRKWCNDTTDKLHDCLWDIHDVRESMIGKGGRGCIYK